VQITPPVHMKNCIPRCFHGFFLHTHMWIDVFDTHFLDGSKVNPCFSPICFGWHSTLMSNLLSPPIHGKADAVQLDADWQWMHKKRWSVGWFGWDFVGDGNRWPTLRKALVEIWDGFLLICFCWGGLDRKNKLNKEFRDKLYKQMHWFGEIMWNIKLWFFHIQLRWDMKTGTN